MTGRGAVLHMRFAQCLKEISPALLEIARTEESKVLSTKEFFKQAPRYKTDKANKEQR